MGMNWFNKILLSVDQLINVLFGGNPDSSISARIGYHVSHSMYSRYWRIMMKIVDTTFYPLDGKYHCFKAYSQDMEDYSEDSLHWFVLGLLGLVTTLACCLLIIPIFILALITNQD
jgi:hypothetical protein